MYVLGIDGGGSRTRALLCDASGRIAGQGLSGGINPRHACTADIRACLNEAFSQSTIGIDPSRIAAVHLGIAGASDRPTQSNIAALAREHVGGGATISVGHDLEIALVGGLGGGKPGIVLVAGTGSACYGHDTNGQSVQCGGWGDLVDDVGSGSWLGLRALQVCVRQADGRLPESPLKGMVMDFLRIDHMEGFKERIHSVGLSRRERATLAPALIQLAACGDYAAGEILSEGMEELSSLLLCTSEQLQLSGPSVLLTGGLMNHEYFRSQLQNAVSRIQPEIRIVEQCLTAVAGATLLALKSARIDVSESTITRLKTHSIL